MKKLIYTLPLLLALGACNSNDDLQIDDQGSGKVETKYYVALNVTLPGSDGTRAESTTNTDGSSSDGTFGGSDNENVLNSAQIYIVDANNQVKVSFNTSTPGNLSDGSTAREVILNGSGTSYKILVQVETGDLKDIVGQDLYMLVVGNSTAHNLSNTVSANDAKFTTFTSLASDPLKDYEDNPSGTPANKGQVLPLVSAGKLELTSLKNISATGSDDEILAAIRALFSSSYTDNTTNTTYNTYQTGTINLERAVARVDFKDIDRTSASISVPYTYQIGSTPFYIVLDQLQIINVNKDSYLFRHTLAGDNTNAYANYTQPSDIETFGIERGTTDGKYNWVVGADWTYSGTEAVKTPSFLSPKSSPDATNGSIFLANLIKRTMKGTTGDEYYPWRYITENTIPTTAMMSEENLPNYATGVAFTFKLLNNNSAHNQVLTYSETEANYPPGVKNSGTTTDKKITVTEPVSGKWMELSPVGTDNHYELTYYGYLVHNAQKVSDDAIGPMYYGVVRNNAYQMKVKSVGNLPDPQDPKSMYLELDINVLPWQKRANEFEF